ncbi:heavy-metal-associated domain-containing protein [Entomomonas sp. E2T0]|uniref:heavy-metal-associated domain-containing protein n=1 Tax=Entomomonas sp. E2T0 TaxID=2930213 RepID=UPI0022283B9D|nr:heavy-metal-associated domain-containing protein [Entomomonas sp. E2T0]UYZ84253.1 heavy-metal-associated domain-containing protein [Entomomonas sp. E2T0]
MTFAIKFYIPDMTCNHCVKTLTSAIQDKDQNAQLEIDLAKHELTIQGTSNPSLIEEIIKEAGFTPQQI